MGHQRYTEKMCRERLCEEPGCVETAAERYRGRFICEDHLNPTLRPVEVEDVVLMRSQAIAFDDVDPGGSVSTRPRWRKR